MKIGLFFLGFLAAVQADDCIVSPDQPCALASLKPSSAHGSALVFPGGKTRCAFDTAISGTFSTNATYFFEVFPSPQPDNRKLLVYFQGGGACVDDQTCSYAFQCASPTPSFHSNAVTLYAGILNRSDPDNAFKDWNIVHVPYCTGDVHTGNRVVTLPDPQLNPQIFHPAACVGKNMTLHQNGAENTRTVLSWALANFPNPSQLVVSGSSAGALGAQLMAAKIAALWQVQEKQIPYAVLPDSYVGILPPNKPVGALLKMYETCSADLALPSSLVAKCENKSLELVELITTLMLSPPTSDWLMLNSNHDQVQRQFYSAVDIGAVQALFHMLSADQFNALLTQVLQQYQAADPRFSSFIINSEMHSFFTRAGWQSITDQTNKTLGDVVKTWLASNAAGSVHA